jgi:solute carrier family 25 protein 38
MFYEQSKRTLGALFGGSTLSASQTGSTIPKCSSSSPPSTSINFVSGALAAGLATTITNPFDVIKTRLQLMPSKYGNMVRAARLMIREDGVRSLFVGLGLRISRKALSSALAWTVYEELIMRAERRWVEEENVEEQLLP